MKDSLINRLLKSEEPSVRFKVLVNILGKNIKSPDVKKLQKQIKSSPRVKTLLSERGKDGRINFELECPKSSEFSDLTLQVFPV